MYKYLCYVLIVERHAAQATDCNLRE